MVTGSGRRHALTVAGRLAALTSRSVPTARSAGTGEAAGPLIAAHRRVFPRADAGLLLRAYRVAERYHRGQTRKSGAPYITHPLAVAMLLADIGMDTTTLAAALLHDTVEDTDLPIGQVKAEFGAEVAILVDGVTKLDGARWGDQAEAETFRKMLMAASIDLRVLVIKLADRVHNMRTLRHHARREKRERIARATLELLVPFAGRLGLYEYLRELEDLAFAVLEPDKHDALRALVRATAPDRAAYLEPLLREMRAELAAAGLTATAIARERHLYSVYRGFPEGLTGTLRPRDAARIVVVCDGPEADCYVALGVLHARWRPVEPRFKDYVAMPKHNMYRSLHTCLLTGDGGWIDVLIRTPAMDEVARCGVAARIRAAGSRTGQVSADVARQADLEWLDRLLAWQPLSPAADYLDSLRADLGDNRIVVFAIDGTPVRLPAGASGVDFAYATSPETADRAVGVLVNGLRKSIENPLAHGQSVELITGPPADPPRSWLTAAHSGQARAHLQRSFARQAAERAALTGRAQLAAAVGGEPDLLDLEADGTVFSVCRRLGYPELDALYEAVGRAEVTPDTLLPALQARPVITGG